MKRNRHSFPGNRSLDASVKWRARQLLLEEQWSPNQISGYLRIEHDVSISHEAIYKIPEFRIKDEIKVAG